MLTSCPICTGSKNHSSRNSRTCLWQPSSSLRPTKRVFTGSGTCNTRTFGKFMEIQSVYHAFLCGETPVGHAANGGALASKPQRATGVFPDHLSTAGRRIKFVRGKAFIFGTFLRNSCFRIRFYCVHSIWL